MSIVIILSVWIALGVGIYAIVRGQKPLIQSIDELEEKIVPIDVEAFSLLMGPSTSRLIDRHLNAKDMRTARRMRARAAIGYVSIMASNAALLVRATEIAKRSTDPGVSEQAKGLQTVALKLRILSLMTMLNLYSQQILPVKTNWHRLLDEYGSFEDSVQYLCMAINSSRLSSLQESA